MTTVQKLHLFQAFGVEMEYMIVDRESLRVKPVADALLHEVTGSYLSDAEFDTMAWSNELVNHVIELKVNGPVPSLDGLEIAFHQQVQHINKLLEKHGAMLMPTGAHPLMDPFRETVIWPHEYNEIYALYNRIFDCRGHGWANLQSTHINLPFADDAEFSALHAAIRLVLPLIPSLCASTPLLDGNFTGFYDSRLEVYRNNQRFIPSITGKVIPEQVFSQAAYQSRIFERIFQDISPYDSEGILKHQFLNSRGAIARFDRGAIEIRLVDLQESPMADVAVVQAIVSVVRRLTETAMQDQQFLAALQSWHEDALVPILLSSIRSGSQAVISNAQFLSVFGISTQNLKANELWNYLYENWIIKDKAVSQVAINSLRTILQHGTLSERISKQLLGKNTQPASEQIREEYRLLCDILAKNQLYIPN